MSRLSANALLLLAAAIWGGAFVAQSNAMAHLGPGWFTGLRFLPALLVVAPMGVIEARRAARPLARRDYLALLPLGLSFGIASLLQQVAIVTTSVTHVGFLTGLYVLFVPLIEIVVLRRRPHFLVLPAAACAIAGTWFLGGGLDGLTTGDLLTIASAFGFAVQIILMDRFVRRTGRPVAAALGQSLFGAATGVLAGLGEPLSAGDVMAVLPELLYAGALSGGVAYLLQAIGQQRTPPADAAVILMSEALFAALFAAVLIGERLSPAGWTGCALLFLGLVIVQLGPLIMPRRVRPPES
ncbi:DMT family transporter [Pseudoxanthobacter sp.]|uniref:DMT family transporter n=1 Tax=Pseudoxanthobacter sp. TaxID=1925742 RepID=UPI002FDF6F55